MELILLERVEGLGNVGDEVSVRPGYGRNFLLPQGKATTATDANRRVFERRRMMLEARQMEELAKAKTRAEELGGLELTITRATSDGEHLYGSVTPNDLAELLKSAGHEIERRHILLDDQIRTIGEHPFRVRLHPDVLADVKVTVTAENV